MNVKSPAAFAVALGVGLLMAPVGASATVTTQLQMDVTSSGIFANYLVNGVEQLASTSCNNFTNCSLSEGFYLGNIADAVNTTVHFNVYKPDGTTLIDYGTASFFFMQNGGLQDFSISVISGDGSPLTSPFSPSDNPISLIQTGDFQTVSSISGVDDNLGNPNDVFLQFRDDVPEPGTMALFGSGLLALVGFGRRRSARA